MRRNGLGKKIAAFALSAAMVLSATAVWVPEKVQAATGTFTSVGGYNETIYAQISGISDSDVTGVSYSGTMSGSLTGEDFTYLVRDNDGGVRIDIPGITAGTYTLTVNTKSGKLEKSGIVVNAYDRSGFAHFNYTKGVGAYKDDGTLKDNAIVLYVTDANKNTVSVTSKDGTTVTGIGNILNSAGQDVGGGKGANGGIANDNKGIIKKLAEDGTPLVVRFIGEIHNLTDTSNPESTQLINGLTEYNSANYGGTVKDGGSMARMKSGKDITLEGIGADCNIDGWGFHFMCESSAPELGKSFEVRNISFTNVPEDSVGMEGVQASSDSTSSDLSGSVERCWVHNCSFKGANFSQAADDDKKEGDGSVDFKRGQYLTVSYNYFEGCHKTNLVGSSDTSLQYNLSYHHNYWYLCKARGPLTRNANVHMYNNVFYGQTDYAMNTRANAYIFSESNLFYMCKSPQAVESGAIKSYNDSFSSYLSNKGTMGTVVADKSQTVSNSCQFAARGIDYSKFDTNASLSYIPSGNYQLQEDLTEMRKVVAAYAGSMKENPITPGEVSLSSVSVIPSSVIPVVVPGDQLPYTIEQSSIGNKGKVEKTIYAFTIPTKSDVTVSYTSEALASTGVLVNEAGVAVLTGSGTAYSLPAGTYAIQPANFNPGDSASVTIGEFKSVTINSIKIESADPNYDPYALTGITMNQSTATLLVDGTVSLSVGYVPSTAKTTEKTQWTSSDASVATVSESGLVTAKKVGTATIAATVGTFTATCKVAVSEPVSINGIVISSDSLTITAGAKDVLTAAVTPASTTEEYEITWASSDKSVATVDSNGNVTAVAEGTATITATATSATGSYKATCKVTVEKGAALPTGDMVHNFTTDGESSTFYNITGNFASNKGTVTYGGLTLTKCLKIESSTNVSFTAPSKGTLTLVFNSENSSDIKIDRIKKTYTEDVLTVDLDAGEHTITKASTANLFYMAFVPEGGSSSGGEEVIAITGLTLNKTSATLKAGGTVELTATIAPDNTTQSKSVNWKSSDPQVATVSGGKVTAISAGTTTITATSVGNNAISATCTITVEGEGGSTGGENGNREKVNGFVKRLYTLALGRESVADAEIASWADVLISSESNGVDAGYGFVFSDETKGKNLSDGDFVEMLYLTFMDRASDEGGKSAWVSQLEAGVTREKIFEGFVMSDEFKGVCAEYGIEVGKPEDVDAFAEALSYYRNQNADLTKFVARCYTKALGRGFDEDGIEAWCRALITGENTPREVAGIGFLSSDEFLAKNLNNEEFVKVLYRTFFDREADQVGLEGWVKTLVTGEQDRDSILEGFTGSEEFKAVLESFGLN